MNRVEIKNEAKAKIKGNLWNIIWPVLVIGVLESVLSSIFGGSPNIDFNNLENFKVPTSYIAASTITSIIAGIVNAGYIKYIINFVRTGNFDTSVIFNTAKEKWLNILIADILVTIIVAVCSVFFVIPGIIMGLAYSFVTYLVVDTDVSGSDSLKKSREMMKGYKMDYFVFGLSFLGWIILVPFTLGILLIWLYPYMTVATAIYYDKLKSLKKE